MIPTYELNITDPSTLYNWIQSFDLQCSPKRDFGLFGSLFFAGVVLSSLIFPRLSDSIGRKKIALFGVLTHLIGAFCVLISPGLNFSLAMNFVMGFAVGGRVYVGYVWLVEHMRTEDAGRATCAMFFFDSSCIFWASLYFRYISKDWRLMFGLPCIALAIAVFFFY